MDGTAIILEAEIGQWVGAHEGPRSKGNPQLVNGADITASGLYWQRAEQRLNQPGRVEMDHLATLPGDTLLRGI